MSKLVSVQVATAEPVHTRGAAQLAAAALEPRLCRAQQRGQRALVRVKVRGRGRVGIGVGVKV